MSPAALSPHAFVAKWRAAAGNERQLYQQHFLDLCIHGSHCLVDSLADLASQVEPTK